MLTKYKEIFFGFAFGLGAMLIDTAMDSITDGNSLADEIAEHPGMLLYRCAFIALGLLLGWLLWKNNQRERQVRNVTEALQKLQQGFRKEALLLSASLQAIIGREDFHHSENSLQLLREVYQRSQGLLRIAEQPIESKTA
jgi:hypothetical protein